MFSIPSHFYLEFSLPAAAAKLLQSLTLCDPIDGSPPGSPIPGILQASTLEWVAISLCLTTFYSFSHLPDLLPGGSEGKASACSAGDPGLTPGSGRSPGEGNTLAWKIPWMEEPGGLQSTGSPTQQSDVTFTFHLGGGRGRGEGRAGRSRAEQGALEPSAFPLIQR